MEESLEQPTSTKFSTFSGVFTPSILTILGVIMFMRAGFVIGEAGIINTLKILLLAKMITVLTTFSISAIATNMEVKGGGAYYLISRTLGAEFGGTIGLTLYFAQVLSIPFYIIGFTEALVVSFPILQSISPYISAVVAILVFALTMRGADGAIKVQFAILLVLLISIFTFLLGAYLDFDMEIFKANLYADSKPGTLSFMALFAIYFPAVTGIMAGVNMSGDLKNPSKSIPLGTFLAIGFGAVIYALQTILIGGSVARDSLISNPYGSLLASAVLGLGFIVSLGVYAATLSSALGSFVGAPRILSAVALDKILKPIKYFAKVSDDGEPRRSIALSFIVTMAVIVWSAMAGKNALNIVAALVSMFFLWTYGIINVAAFVESFGSNPSFRPRFKFFHWSLAFIGAVGCIGAAFLIDVRASLGAMVFIILLLLYVRKTMERSSFGDSRRGYFYQRVKQNLVFLSNTEKHAKNWRPTIILFTSNPATRAPLAHFAHWLGSGRGILFLAQVYNDWAPGMSETGLLESQKKLEHFCINTDIQAFPQIIHTNDGFQKGMFYLLQTSGIGEIRPNLVMMGAVEQLEQMDIYMDNINKIASMGKSLVVMQNVKGWKLPERKINKRIDIWWNFGDNSSLITILAWLLTLNNEWANSRLRFLRVVEDEQEGDALYSEIERMVNIARIDADILPVIGSVSDITDIMVRESSDAALIFTGFSTPFKDTPEMVFGRLEKMKECGVPVLYVYSNGEADLLA